MRRCDYYSVSHLMRGCDYFSVSHLMVHWIVGHDDSCSFWYILKNLLFFWQFCLTVQTHENFFNPCYHKDDYDKNDKWNFFAT
jgi:hypothetical protein